MYLPVSNIDRFNIKNRYKLLSLSVEECKYAFLQKKKMMGRYIIIILLWLSDFLDLEILSLLVFLVIFKRKI